MMCTNQIFFIMHNSLLVASKYLVEFCRHKTRLKVRIVSKFLVYFCTETEMCEYFRVPPSPKLKSKRTRYLLRTWRLTDAMFHDTTIPHFVTAIPPTFPHTMFTTHIPTFRTLPQVQFLRTRIPTWTQAFYYKLSPRTEDTWCRTRESHSFLSSAIEATFRDPSSGLPFNTN